MGAQVPLADPAGRKTVHSTVAPVDTTTVPVGVPVYCGVTVTEKAAASSRPKAIEEGATDTVVVVVAAVRVSTDGVVDDEVEKFPSPA